MMFVILFVTCSLRPAGAQELARAIEGFEERLVTIESNVHKEILALKGSAEALHASSGGGGGSGSGGGVAGKGGRVDVDSRLRGLEDGVAAILAKLNSSVLKSK